MTHEEIEQLMDDYSLYMLKLAYVYVKNRQSAEDIVQEVFLQLYEQSHYREQGEIKSYLTTLVVNRSKNYLKSWSYRMLLFKEVYIEKSTTNKDALIADEERKLIGEAIFKLPLKYREVLYFHYYEELKTAQMAEMMKIPESTVKTRLVKARKLLKDKLP
ncbi:sigma-70 family RNA polymerase sigma factor [Solibacillus silvestris]|uniref:sigma-70 family RNA polymerase sigma factor n=1 Tax=Solibacillus silvestris TaxID=76853 RepID=UPI003F7FAFCA